MIRRLIVLIPLLTWQAHACPQFTVDTKAGPCPPRVREMLALQEVHFPAHATNKRLTGVPDECLIGSLRLGGRASEYVIATMGRYDIGEATYPVEFEFVRKKGDAYLALDRPLAELRDALCQEFESRVKPLRSMPPTPGPRAPVWDHVARYEPRWEGNRLCLELTGQFPLSGKLRSCAGDDSATGSMHFSPSWPELALIARAVTKDVETHWPGAKTFEYHADLTADRGHVRVTFLVRVDNFGDVFHALYHVTPDLRPRLITVLRDGLSENWFWKDLHARPPDPFAARASGVNGEPGLKLALATGHLRPATRADFDRARDYLHAAARRQAEDPKEWSAPELQDWMVAETLKRAFVVTKTFDRLPAFYGEEAKIFIVPVGVPKPGGNLGHSALIDLNDPKCPDCVHAARELLGSDLGLTEPEDE